MEQEIKQVDDEINNIAYDIYGISEGEIKVIENSLVRMMKNRPKHLFF